MQVLKAQTGVKNPLQSRIIRVVVYGKDAHQTYVMCTCCGHREQVDAPV